MTKHEHEIVKELAGLECRCGNPKEPRQTFCRKCYYRLPPRMRSALYQRLGEGYAEAHDEAAGFLKTREARDGKL